MLSDQRYLFTKMGLSAENHHTLGSLAKAPFPVKPIHTALSGTELARLKDGMGLLNSLCKFTLILQILIGGSPRPFLFLIRVKRDGRQEKKAA